MRQQAIEKLGNLLVEELQQYVQPPVIRNYIAKWKILTDRTNGDKAQAVVREIMNK